MRMIYNDAFALETHTQPADTLIDASSDVRLRSLTITVGNLCNLQCRMCNPFSSSRIAADPIHSGWFGHRSDRDESKDIESAYAEIIKSCSSITHLQISGGEPLIIPKIHKILQSLIDSGRAQNVVLMMPTNCTGVGDPVLARLSKFKEVHLRMSLDGHGPANEYIRYPSKWSEIVDTIIRFKGLPHAKLSIGFTLSALNVFEVVRTAQFGDAMGIPFTFGVVHTPSRLSPNILPQATLEHAAVEIDEAVDSLTLNPSKRELRAISRLLLSFARQDCKENEELWSKFVQFTNDLDRSRGQSIETSLPDLITSLRVEKGPWQHDLFHILPKDRAKPVPKAS